MADARDVVCRRLARQARRFPELAIGGLDDRGLAPRDAALAHAIYEQCLVRWLTIERVLEVAGGRPMAGLEPKVRAVLMCGTAQLLFMDRVPDHAAIDESVRWAKGNVRAGAGGIVNAILRKVVSVRGASRDMRGTWTGSADEIPLSGGGALALQKAVFEGAWHDALSGAASMPSDLLVRWERSFGRERAASLARHGLVRSPIVVNVAHAKSDLSALPLGAHDADGSAVWNGSAGELTQTMDQRDDIWVQDAGTASSIMIAKNTQPCRIVDVWGQGTKTRQLRAMFPDAEIVAAEVDRPRLDELARVFAGDERVRAKHVKKLIPEFAGWADLVVFDVPCSNTGVLPRRPEARYRATADAIERLAGVQRQIVADAVPLLAPGGRVAYCTCSVEEDENERVVDWAAEQHGWQVEKMVRAWPEGVPGGGADGGSRAYRDASFAALLIT